MKKLIAIALCLIMICSLCACNKKDDAAQIQDGETVTAYKLTEVVGTEKDFDGSTHTWKAVLEYDKDHYVIGGKTYIDDKLTYEFTYDKSPDKPLLELEYDEDGNVTDRTEYTYDEKGNCTQYISTYEYDGETIVTKRVTTYDENNRILTEISHRNDEFNYKRVYTYTATGKIATETQEWEGERGWRETYTYDEYDNVLKITRGSVTAEDGDLRETTYENTYENGKLVEVKCYEDGALFRIEKYDADGNEIFASSYNDGAEMYRIESTYENGNLVKEVEYYDGKQESVEEFTYNADGKLLERKYSDGQNERKRTCSYDANGILTGYKLTENGEVNTEYTLKYETVTVSKETAEEFRRMIDMLGFAN